MNEVDSEKQWQELANVWKQQPVSNEVPAVVLKWVRSQERRMRVMVILEWLIALSGGIYVVEAVLSRNQPDTISRLVFVLSMLALAMVFSVINRRGLWAPLEESTKAYIELGLLRLKRKRREIYFGWFLLLLQVFIIGIWEFARFLRGALEPLVRNPQEAFMLVSSLVVALGLYSFYICRRTEKEKRVLTGFQKNL
ncbi:hypothetical protein ACJJIK_14200 [Microbulbifer sp. ZKSA006]|uniref:hypothetical protein n=1 Tax=Microbulbifer sp. ZKSA006 TaxID=3243390 RepID=UPI004039FBEB